MSSPLFIGLDFGTDSVRALVADADGQTVADAVRPYPRWAEGRFCAAAGNQFRQHPLDYLEALADAVRDALQGIDPSRVLGIGIDTTASTPCLVDQGGRPLALRPEFADDPDAMFILWKDHTAIAEATRFNEVAHGGAFEDYTRYEGGAYSEEWFWSKVLHVLRGNPRVRDAAASAVECCDWIPAELCGAPVKPGRCARGHKAMWHASWGGLPPAAFFHEVDPLLDPVRASLGQDSFTADVPVGRLAPAWAHRLGLPASVAVSGGVIDCHMGAVGANVAPGTVVKVCGTSTCDVLVAPSVDRCIEGICGQVDGSVVPGLVGLEAGQASFGDVYAWLRKFLGYAGQVSIAQIEAEAAALPPSPSPVAALDWFNGRRTPYADASRSGAIVGLTLGTTVPMVYRALAEATVFGSRAIIDHFVAQGVAVERIVATGGIARKSPYVMQLLADVLDRSVAVADCDQTCALGGAIFGAVAAGFLPSVPAAMERMAARPGRTYTPRVELVPHYASLYRRYLDLGRALGGGTGSR